MTAWAVFAMQAACYGWLIGPLAPKPLHYALFHSPLRVEFLAAKGRFIAAKWYAWKNVKI